MRKLGLSAKNAQKFCYDEALYRSCFLIHPKKYHHKKYAGIFFVSVWHENEPTRQTLIKKEADKKKQEMRLSRLFLIDKEQTFFG